MRIQSMIKWEKVKVSYPGGVTITTQVLWYGVILCSVKCSDSSCCTFIYLVGPVLWLWHMRVRFFQLGIGMGCPHCEEHKNQKIVIWSLTGKHLQHVSRSLSRCLVSVSYVATGKVLPCVAASVWGVLWKPLFVLECVVRLFPVLTFYMFHVSF